MCIGVENSRNEDHQNDGGNSKAQFHSLVDLSKAVVENTIFKLSAKSGQRLTPDIGRVVTDKS